jgi:LCP family protein required for cell wall assembly
MPSPRLAQLPRLQLTPGPVLQRYGLILAPILVVLGFFMIVGSARALLAAPKVGVTTVTANQAAADGTATYLHDTPYLTNTQNILLLGSDRRAETPNWRTDVMMILAIDRATGAAGVISIPRDLYVDIPNRGMGRMNTADYFGSNGGEDMAAGARTMAEIIRRDMGIAIDNYIRLDFTGFRQVIDALGGIDVEVDCPLEDYFLEVAIGRPRIEAGIQHMDGQTALAYVRTRRQGGDFDRARRQQRVLMAVRNRAVSADLLPRLPSLIPAALQVAETDLNPFELMSLARFGVTMDLSKLKGFVIDANMTEFYTTEDGAEVLKPDWDAIHKATGNLFAPSAKSLLEVNDRSTACPQ